MIRCSLVLIVIACISTAASFAFAEDNAVEGGTIRGQVLEYGKTQSPVEGVIIKIISANGKEWTVKTDTNGEYKFANLPAGNYTLKYLQEGFQNKGRGNQSVSVVNGEDQIVELKTVNWLNRVKGTVEYGILPLLDHVSGNLAKHYGLDETTVNALQQSIHESVETAIKQRNNLSDFLVRWDDDSLDVFEELLLRQDIKTAFTKHLTETQLKDFTNIPRHQEKEANAHYSTASLDQELSLTADQHQKIVQLRLNSEANEAWLTVLTETQKKILQLTDEENTKASIKRQIYRTQNHIVTCGVDDKIAAARLEEQKKKAEMLESHERTKQLAEAILASHTEQLGTLNEKASQQLNLIAKIVAQKYLEAEKVMTLYRETEANLINAVEAKEITPELADERLKNLSRKLWNEKDANKQSGDTPDNIGFFSFHFFTRFTQIAAHRRALINGIVGGKRGFSREIYMTTELNYPTYDITYHPLYQQTLKDVLSEKEYAQYTALQSERENFRQQALRDLAVANLDTLLLLNDMQRKQLKMTAAKLTVTSLSWNAPRDMFDKLITQIDDGVLSRWQRDYLYLYLSLIDEI
ncbi:MAG: carboxypeptidase-like regulatory domain-containing protein [Candidatus Poribacteria bacterium]|nr:carboxypeptidase-like regulatory domain-containing protein [Candidatus Poribacteria bacterium]